ncbi:MAG: M28 family metallopeptidase [Anaerolineae bacterium]|nr:M28 family metallopeptidase [Anaerolineae bacterium]
MNNLIKSIEAHVHTLSENIGARMIGTAANAAAADYIYTQMKSYGLDVERQPYYCPAWQCEYASLTANGSNLDVLVNPYSPSCDVNAPFISAATLAELENADLSEKIAILYGDLTRAPLSAKSWFLKDERDDRIITLLETKKPLAVLTVQIDPHSINRLIEDWEFLIPSATLPAESARVLFSRETEQIHLTLKTTSHPGSTANIIGRRAGKRPETLVFCAHYDTKIDTPGAGDNAGGVAALLALAEQLSRTPTETGLEFIAMSGEEYLPIGDDTYLEKAGEDHLNQVLLMINYDGAGHLLDANSLAIFTSSAAFQEEMVRISRAFPAVQWVEPWPESNHSTFSWRGVPALAFSSRALRIYGHQYNDSARWISPERIAEAVNLTREVINNVQSRPLGWLRPQAESI